MAITLTFLQAAPLHIRQNKLQQVPFQPISPHPARCPTQEPHQYVVALAGSKKGRRNFSPTILNRQASFRYELLDTYECGIELLGTEVKSIRNGQLNLKDGHARVKNGELFLHNVHISEWSQAHKAFNHEPLRTRKLLLHKRIIRKLAESQLNAGLTIIPTKTYFSSNGFLKVEIALARGKQLHDKREAIKKRDADRDLQRAVKQIVR